MNHLIRMIDEYKDTHGSPSDSSIARAIGIKPQTLSSWRHRGIREMPRVENMRKLAEFIGRDFETEVVPALLMDTGYVSERHPEGGLRRKLG